MEGDAGKVICKEAERIKPAAVVMGTRGRSLIQRFAPPFPFSVSETLSISHLVIGYSDARVGLFLLFSSVCCREVLVNTAFTTVKQHLL